MQKSLPRPLPPLVRRHIDADIRRTELAEVESDHAQPGLPVIGPDQDKACWVIEGCVVPAFVLLP